MKVSLRTSNGDVPGIVSVDGSTVSFGPLENITITGALVGDRILVVQADGSFRDVTDDPA